MANRNLEGRKVVLFVALVVVALGCLGLIVYSLFFARPRTNPEIENGGHSSLRLTDRSSAAA